jgi:hypothetical protein
MANMRYVRFENTYRDLRDCYDSMEDKLSRSEEGYRYKLIQLAKKIVDDYGDIPCPDDGPTP